MILVNVVDPMLQILWKYCNVLVSVFIFIKLIRLRDVCYAIAGAWARSTILLGVSEQVLHFKVT